MNRKFFIPLIGLALLVSACGKADTSSIASSVNSNNSISINSESAPQSSSSQSNNVSSFNSSSNQSSFRPSSSISSNSSVSSSNEQRLTVVFNNKSTQCCDLVDVTTKGYEGDDAFFTIRMKQDFEFISVKAENSQNKTLSLNKEGTMTYSVEIPSDGIINVTVTAKEINKTQRLFIKDEKNLLTSSIEYLDGEKYVRLDTYHSNEGNPYFEIPEGSTIRFKLPRPSGYKDLGITYNNKEYTPDYSGYVVIDFARTSGDLNVVIHGIKIESNLVAHNSEHLTITFYSDKNLTDQITKIGVEEAVYIKITSTDIESYTLATVIISGCEINSDYPFSADYTNQAEFINNSYFVVRYQTRSSQMNSDGLNVTVIEDDLTKFLDQEFVGNYITFYTFTYKYQNYTSFSESGFSILGSGKATYGSGSPFKINNLETNPDGSMNLKDRRDNSIDHILYKDGIAIFCFENNAIKSPFTKSVNNISDDKIAFKMLPNTDTFDYSLKAQSFTLNGTTYTVATVFYQNSIYKSIYLEKRDDRSEQVVIFNPEIEMLYGNYVTDNQSIFSVKNEGSLINIYGFKGNGGASNRCICDDKGGVYTGTGHTLVICNSVAIFDGEMYVVNLTGNQLRLETVIKQYLLELDFTNKTFTVISSVEHEAIVGPFAGKKYRRTQNTTPHVDYRGESYSIYVEFHRTEPKMSLNVAIYYDVNMDNTINNFARNVNATYLYDPNSKVIKAALYGVGNELYIMEFTYTEAGLVFAADQLSGNQGLVSNVTVTIPEIA